MDNVNLFFSCDDNYVPFLGVTITSIRANRARNRRYILRILHTGMALVHMETLKKSFADENFEILFCDISSRIQSVAQQLHTRDYFSQSTYYRLFIPDMFPELDKGLYLDSDLVVRGDIAELYDTPLGDNLVGAAPDAFVGGVEVLRQYVSSRIGVADPAEYFNAGILLMNLEAMRRFHFQKIFLELLETVTFRVAQDQDYLNAICKGRVTYLDRTWNTMPRGVDVVEPKLIHYNVDSKPWHGDGVKYQEYFWEYADRSPYAEEIRNIRRAYTQADTDRSLAETVNLIALAGDQAGDAEENRRIQTRIAKVVGQ